MSHLEGGGGFAEGGTTLQVYWLVESPGRGDITAHFLGELVLDVDVEAFGDVLLVATALGQLDAEIADCFDLLDGFGVGLGGQVGRIGLDGVG